MQEICPFLIKYKDFQSINSSGMIYKCTLANTLLKSGDLDEKWACGGCQVPAVMADRPCRHLKPHKTFLIRGSSQTWFNCDMLNIVMEMPKEFCHLQCNIYDPVKT
jgi:hypothetical protein